MTSNFVALYADGKVASQWTGDYFEFLTYLHSSFLGARPAILICDGKMVVSAGLTDLATEYVSALQLNIEAAKAGTKAEFMPAWNLSPVDPAPVEIGGATAPAAGGAT